MYGLLLDSIQKFLREKYGEHYWVTIRRRAKLDNHWFVTHEVYSDSVMSNLIDAAASTLGEDRDRVMEMFGEYFVQTIGRYGYARLLRVLGRDLRHFLNGLDDLHEYLRFSYPKMRPPSFFCEQETAEGVVMHYTTKRRGYLSYVIGQLHAVGLIYQKEVQVTVLSDSLSNNGECRYVLNLQFDNSEMLEDHVTQLCHHELDISSTMFLSLFPFTVVFDKDMTIVGVGEKLLEVLPHLYRRTLDQIFILQRPLHVQLNWDSITMHTNCVFEVMTVESICRQPPGTRPHGSYSPSMQFASDPPHLKLKGQMKQLSSNSDFMMFLCSPVICSPEDLYESGIYISDMPMHDSSRDYILAGSQQHPELMLALNQEQIRSKQLEDNIQKTDSLLYQMIPKLIADKLREGETPLNTCKQWHCVSILFADIVGFTPMCSRLTPMEVVCLLNAIYVIFDELCEKHYVYKVQTIGDACMVLSGAPVEIPNHADLITEYGFSIIEAIGKVLDPSTRTPLSIRVGIHSGTVVAGVVGASFIRYDVFGDTVNTAARMENTGKPMKIHVSEVTANLLDGTNFIIEERGEMEVKGKGTMKTFWVTGKKGSSNDSKPIRPKSPLFETDRGSISRSGHKNHPPSSVNDETVWPRHKSVPVVSMNSRRSRESLTPRSMTSERRPRSRESLTPERWPELDDSLAPPRACISTSSPTLVPPGLSSIAEPSISIEDVDKITSSLANLCMSRPSVGFDTLEDFVEFTEENARRSRQVADWAKSLLDESTDQSAVRRQSKNKIENDNESTSRTDVNLPSDEASPPDITTEDENDYTYCLIL